MDVIGKEIGVMLRVAIGLLTGRQAAGRMIRDKNKRNKRGGKLIAISQFTAFAPLSIRERGRRYISG